RFDSFRARHKKAPREIEGPFLCPRRAERKESNLRIVFAVVGSPLRGPALALRARAFARAGAVLRQFPRSPFRARHKKAPREIEGLFLCPRRAERKESNLRIVFAVVGSPLRCPALA